MKIGIDVDETFVDTAKSFDNVIKKYNVEFNKKYSEYWTEKEAKFLLENYGEEILSNAGLKYYVKEALDYLNRKGHELFIITARGGYVKNAEAITYNLIKENDLPIKGIYCNQHKKYDICKKLDIDLMIDDNINIYNNMKKEGIDCILFGDKIKNWKEVINYINRKEK